MTRETIGFIGLGNIGRPMATHIAGAGFGMVVCDIAGRSERAPDGVAVGISAADVVEAFAAEEPERDHMHIYEFVRDRQ